MWELSSGSGVSAATRINPWAAAQTGSIAATARAQARLPAAAGSKDEVRDLLEEFGFTAHIRARGEEAQALKHEAGFKARRWVVDRSHL
jgi:hypothetical protein